MSDLNPKGSGSENEIGQSSFSNVLKSTAETSYLPELIALLQNLMSGEVLPPPRVENFREEVLGFESMRLASSIIPGELPKSPTIGEDGPARVLRKVNREERRALPPLLTTLKWNGKPRFRFARESTEDGRLVICMVRNERREVARRPADDGRLRMVLVGPDDQDDGDDDGGEGGG